MMALRTLEEYELRDSKVDVRVEAEKSATKRENPEKAFRDQRLGKPSLAGLRSIFTFLGRKLERLLRL